MSLTPCRSTCNCRLLSLSLFNFFTSFPFHYRALPQFFSHSLLPERERGRERVQTLLSPIIPSVNPSIIIYVRSALSLSLFCSSTALCELLSLFLTFSFFRSTFILLFLLSFSQKHLSNFLLTVWKMFPNERVRERKKERKRK